MAERFAIPSPGAPMWWGDPGSPLVILVHDSFGRLPWMETVAALLAEGGFRIAVPDLYSGIATASEAQATRLMAALDVRRALELLDQAVAAGRAEGSERVGVVGYSMGGWLSLLHAQAGSADAVVAFYATLAPAEHGVLPCPVMLHLAEHDEWGSHEDPADFIERLEKHGTPVIDHHYPGTRHGFSNGSVPGLFDAHAAQLALARTGAFLGDYLRD